MHINFTGDIIKYSSLAAILFMFVFGNRPSRPSTRTRKEGLWTNSEKDLVAAAKKGDVQTIKSLIADGCDVNREGNFPWSDTTALHGAIWEGHTDIAEELIKNGADVNAKDWNGATPLHFAARKGDENLVKFLLKYKASLDIEDKASKRDVKFVKSQNGLLMRQKWL
ncbi:uncharacterized protein [Ptychodera flava]|uniref:uncharacterized protein n=1 Tax=Ptychodera flava TaxID=63121 RepID=UPI003969EDDA